MAEESADVKRQLEEHRERIGRGLNSLESDLGRARDWKGHVRQHPWWALGAGFAAGLLISGIARSGVAAHGYSHLQRQTGALGQRLDRLLGAALEAVSESVEETLVRSFPILQSRTHRMI